jgi:hypothetical protein
MRSNETVSEEEWYEQDKSSSKIRGRAVTG